MTEHHIPINIQNGLEIAVIGMAGRFPGAKNVEQFWENIKNGVESICFFSDEELLESGVDPELLKDSHYIKAKGLVEGIEYFDAYFFDYSPQDAGCMDPQIRIFLECAWEALENAGYNPGEYEGLIGVYAGSSFNIQWMKQLLTLGDDSLYQQEALVSNFPEYFSPRISYKFNLGGPSVTINTACSTSLAALHLACQGLLNGECNIALAGAVTISIPKKNGYLYQEGMALSPDGHCRTFDANAGGMIFGSGAGVVVIKTFEDAAADGDTIYALIKGSAINNDGAQKVGFAAPSVNGQANVIKAAHYMAEVEPSSLSYLETHGTGTAYGDSIEMEALTRAFNTTEKGFCRIGSVKTNLGNLETAAGITGLIKTVLGLKYKVIPPSLHFQTPNPTIDFENTPFYVNTRLTPWETHFLPRRAGVNSFGVGGSNAYVILEEYIQSPAGTTLKPGHITKSRPWKLLVFSARSRTALDRLMENFRIHLEKNPDINLDDAAYTLQVGRKAFEHRAIVVFSDAADAVKQLSRGETLDTSYWNRKTRPLLFMFSANGSPGNPAETGLYRDELTFHQEVDHCMEILRSHSPGAVPGNPAIDTFVYEYALARLLVTRGVTPTAAIGDGTGEYNARCLQGELSLEKALGLVLEPPQKEPASQAQKFTEFVNKTAAVLVRLSREPGSTSVLSRNPGKTADHGSVSCVVHLHAPHAPHIGTSGSTFLLNCIGQLWLKGIKVDWKKFYAGQKRYRIPLPTYPFEGKYYWMELPGESKKPVRPAASRKKISKEPKRPRPELETPYEPPANELELALVKIWQNYFGIEPIGVRDDFIRLGGDSFKAAIILAIIYREFNLKINLPEFFKTPTIRELAKWTGEKAEAEEEFSSIEPAEKKEYYVLSSAQKRLFTLQQLNTELLSFNETFAESMEGELDKNRFEEITRKLIKRHESLRTTFEMIKDVPVQRIHDDLDFGIQYYETVEDKNEVEVKPGETLKPSLLPIISKFIRPFDLSRGPLLRVGLIKLQENRHLLVMDMHHIITDGLSQVILMNNFMELYRGNELPALRIRYKDYSQWSNSEYRAEVVKKQEVYWLKKFETKVPSLELPTDYTRPSLQSMEGNTCSFTIDKDDTNKIRQLAAKYEVTLFMISLALLTVLMSKLSGNEDIAVGVVSYGRSHADLQGIVGMFVNVLCLRNFPCKDKTFEKLLMEVKECSLQAFENQDYQFEDLVEKIGVRRDPARHPLFDVGLGFQGEDLPTKESSDLLAENLTMKPYVYKKKISRIDMTFFGSDARNHLDFDVEYCTKLFKEETINNFIKYFKTILSVVLNEPGIKISEIEIISSDETQKIFSEIQEKNKEIDIQFDF